MNTVWITQAARYAAPLTVMMLIVACGGGGGGGSSAPSPTFTVGGSVTGLASGESVILANGSERLTVTADGSFSFKTSLAGNATYAVTVVTAPTNKACAVSNGSGTISSNVSTVLVTCKIDRILAVSDTEIFSIPRWIMLNGTRSVDPNDKPLTCNWTFVSTPDGFAGPSFQSSDGCLIAFNPNSRDGGPALGVYRVALRVSNGVDTSSPLDIRLEVCCSGFANVAEAEAHIKKLPIYSTTQAKALFTSYKPDNDPDYFKFAALYGFSPYHLDYLRGLTPGATMRRIVTVPGRDFVGSPPNGGASIVGFSMSIPEVIQTDLDLSKVTYPKDYSASAATTAEVDDPFCANTATRNTYRLSDLGDYPLPEIKATALPGTALRMAYIKDIWSLLTPNLAQGCVYDMGLALDSMFDRLERMNVNSVAVTPWGWFDARKDKWRVVPAGDKSSDIYPSEWTDENLKWFVDRAKKRGFKVYWVNQIQAAFKTQTANLSVGDTTASDIRKAFDALDDFLLARGRYLQTLGVDGIILNSWYWTNFESYLPVTEFSSRTAGLIEKLRENFRGKVVYSFAGADAITSELSSRIDYFVYPLGVRYSAEDIKNFSVADVKNKLELEYTKYASKLGGKPILWQPHIQSRREFFTTQDYYDPFCTPRGDIQCPQEGLRGDLSMQAIFSQATLEFISTKPAVMIGGVSMEYHMNANNLPPSNFFNIDATVRGKPAEYIFYKWFTAK